MAKRSQVNFTHKRVRGLVELIDGKPSMVCWQNATVHIECCCPEMRASIDQALFALYPDQTFPGRLSRLEDQVRALGAKLEQALAHLDLLMGGAVRGE